MKTQTRRFVLRLIIALLTFLIGVFAVAVLGRFNSPEGQHPRPQFSRCSGGDDRALQESLLATPAVRAPEAVPAPQVIRPVYRPRLESSDAPAAHRQAAEPALPSFEDEGEIKSQRQDTSRALQ